MSLIPQEYLTQREDMIRTEYQKWYPVPCEEEKQHIENMKNEGQCVFKKFRERRNMMLLNSIELRELYEELMVLSQKPHLELLLVSMEEGRRSLCCLRPTLVIVMLRLLSIVPAFVLGVSLSGQYGERSIIILKEAFGQGVWGAHL